MYIAVTVAGAHLLPTSQKSKGTHFNLIKIAYFVKDKFQNKICQWHHKG